MPRAARYQPVQSIHKIEWEKLPNFKRLPKVLQGCVYFLADTMLVHYFADFYSKRKLTVKLFLVWVVWLIVGAAFYAYVLDVGWAKGFYHAISVGYSIGWT